MRDVVSQGRRGADIGGAPPSLRLVGAARSQIAFCASTASLGDAASPLSLDRQPGLDNALALATMLERLLLLEHGRRERHIRDAIAVDQVQGLDVG
jgi:hypothetical protein